MRRIALAVSVAFLMIVVAAVPLAGGAPTLGTGSSSRLSPQEAKVLRSLDYDNAWRYLEYLSSLGEKSAGTPEEWSAQRYVYDELSKLPVDEVWWETFPVEQWVHYGTTVKVVSNGFEDIPATTYGSAPSVWGTVDGEPYYLGNVNDGKTVLGELVDVGYGTIDDYAKVGDISGKIVLVHRNDDIQCWPDTAAREAALRGAVAAMFYGYFTGNDLPEGIKQDSVFSPIPAISISPISAWHLQDLMKAGPVTVQIDGRVDFLSAKHSESVNVAAVMWGATRPDEYVVISGHIDTWWYGSNDDCSSIAAMLELARLLSEARAAGDFVNDRTIIFCSVGAEEAGGPDGTWYNWLVGSYEFVQAHPEVMTRLAVELNMDGVSFTRTSGRYWIENTWETNMMVSGAIRDLGVTGMVSYYNPVWSWTDAWSFAAKGGGSAVQMMWMTGFDPYYHTQLDTIELQGHELLDLVLKLHGLMAMRSANAIVLPLDLTATCDWAAARLKSERMMVPEMADKIDAARAALAELREQAAAATAYGRLLTELYAKAGSPQEKATVRALADDLNRAIIEARRIITPWTIGEGGVMGSWDVFLRPDQHVNDLAYVNSAIFALTKGQTRNALSALENVYTMQWGKYFSEQTYQDEMDSMDQCFMYWGDDFDQQQAYVDVHAIYFGLRDGTMNRSDALAALKDIKSTQLVPWLEADLATLAWAWDEAAGVLDAAVP
ncbi:MAG: M28 family peptidase [Thermoplasmata archaeon]